MIPKPETTEPLSAEVSSPATVHTETTTTEPATEAVAPATPAVNGVKTDKRKSSFPFAFGKKTDGATTPEGEAASPDAEKKSPNAFSKFRATIKVSP